MIPFVTVVRLSQGGVTPGCHMFSIGKPVNRTEPAFPAPNGCSNSSNNSRCLVWCCLWQKKWKRKRNCGEIKKKNLQTLFFFLNLVCLARSLQAQEAWQIDLHEIYWVEFCLVATVFLHSLLWESLWAIKAEMKPLLPVFWSKSNSSVQWFSLYNLYNYSFRN